MDLLRVEQQRQALEATLATLRTSLKYWQTYDVELEGLKEDLEASVDQPDLDRISQTFNGDHVSEKEIRELAALDSHAPRTTPQILGIISRRQEYVQKNIDTVQRQFWDSEAKLEELDFMALSSAGRVSDEGDLPLTEIIEELDDDGNVISSKLSRPEQHTAHMVDALRKAGLSDTDLQNDGSNDQALESEDDSTNAATVHAPRSAMVEKPFKVADSARTTNGTHHSPERPPIRKKSVSFTADTKPSPTPVRQDSEDGKKCVSFNDKVAVMPAAPPPDSRSVSFSPQIEEIPAEPIVASPELKTTLEPLAQDALRGMMFKPGDKVNQIDDEAELVGTHVVQPESETEEEAKIRREMLNYHLHEVGNVVAQLDLEEADDMDEVESASASDFASDYLDDDTSNASRESETEDDSEDEFGRTKRRVISDDYHKKMQDLERRLIGNLGPAPSAQDVNALDPAIDPSDVRRLVIREKRNSLSSASSDGEKKSNGKKRVSFAETLDVADGAAVPPAKAMKHQEGENAAPISETVLERTKPAAASEAQPPTPAKMSRFKKQQSAPPPSDDSNSAPGYDDNGEPTGPVGKIIADTLFERPSSSRKKASAPSIDDPDPIMQRRELAAEYYRRRNDMIRQQGGFKAQPDDEELGEWMEEKDGKLKKVSRFKAARIKPQ